jgi:hypothetical protein
MSVTESQVSRVAGNSRRGSAVFWFEQNELTLSPRW